MLQVNIGRVLIFVVCIYTSKIPITMALMTDTNEASVNDDIMSTTVERETGVTIDLDPHEITCPASCECNRNEPGSSITARCTEMFDGSYAELNIKHFILETSDNITLGSHDIHAHGLDYSASIAITNQPNTFDPTVPNRSQSCVSKTPDYHGWLNIHPDIFQNNSQLHRLTIYQFEHFMDDCNTTRNYLFDAQTLTEFTLSVSNYKCWSSSTFSKMPKLNYLCLQSPNFEIVPGIFKPLRNLVELEMRQISNLNILQNTFDGINLEKLTLAYSFVESLANIQSIGLQYLCLEWNSMKHINKDDFLGLPGLVTLVIMDTLETIHEDAFTHLTHLKYLDIQFSNIVTFTEYHLRDNFRLETLTMANNDKIRYLPVFQLNATCKTYNIYELECSSCSLRTIRDRTFDAMPKLVRLDLYKNGLRKLPRGLFKPLSSLKVLNLSKNLIANIPDDMFEGAIELNCLILGENPLTTLKMSSFLRTPKLSILDLGDCQIKTWSAPTLPLNSLQFLSIYGNDLKHVTVELLKTMPNLKELKTIDNPIQCDDGLQTLVNWATSHHIKTQFTVSISSFCIPDDYDKSCWEDFQNVICDPNYISELELLKEDIRSENRQYVSMYDDQSSMCMDITSNNTLSTDMPYQGPSDQLPPSTNGTTTGTESLSNLSASKVNNKSATETISFLVIILTSVIIIITT